MKIVDKLPFCTTCGKPIPVDVKFCPSCGAPTTPSAVSKVPVTSQPVKASHTKRNVLVIVVVFLLILIVAGASYRPSPKTSSGNSTGLQTATTPEHQYDAVIRYTEKYQESIEISDAKPGYIYLILTMQIQNNIDRALTSGPSYFYVTTNNVKYDYSGATFWLTDELSCCPELQKDGVISGSVAFEVPVGTTIYTPSYEAPFISWDINWIHYINAMTQLILELYSWDLGANTITGSLRNVGSQAIDLKGTNLFLNGMFVGNPDGNCITNPLAPSSACMFSIAVPTFASWVSGAAYPLKIVTPSGGIFSYSVIAGGSN